MGYKLSATPNSVIDYIESLEKNQYPIALNRGRIRVCDLYKKTSTVSRYRNAISETCRYIGAQNFIELGTSLGVTTMQLALSTREINGVSIDHERACIEFCREVFDRYGIRNVGFVEAKFESELENSLRKLQYIDLAYIDGDHQYEATIQNTKKILPYLSSRSVIILDDIRWSRDMHTAWNELISLEDFHYTIDYGRIGFLFRIEGALCKEHFLLR